MIETIIFCAGLGIGSIATAVAISLCKFLAYDTAMEENAAMRQELGRPPLQ